MSDIIDQFCPMTRQRPVRRFNPRKGLLSLALLASAACIAPPAFNAGLAQTTAAAQPSADTASYTAIFDDTLKFNADTTSEYTETRRIKVLGVAALQQISQQRVSYTEGKQSLDIVEAFTEKPDGTRVPVDRAGIITRDGTTSANAEYVLDLKTATVIFPEVAVGDTVVLTARITNRIAILGGNYMRMFPLFGNISRAALQVIAPSNLPLNVGVRGDGVKHVTTAEGTETRHVITYQGGPAVHVEDRMTSSLDRAPAIFVSTFETYEDLARAYWDGAHGAIEVTPEIARLADEITRGLDDRRAQARAISDWVKTNIRWINVMLGDTGWVPHNSAAVLKKRYGDCKDHTVLMSALLAAKGIDTELVLINSSDSYDLPKQAAVSVFNHTILYLPEFGVYDDPTAHFSSFGVLSTGEYDKPVLHASARGARRTRTPAMKPEDHVSIRRTRLTISADGIVSGETETSATGWFAMNARGIAASLQAKGLERSVEDALSRANTPGKGRIEIGTLTDLGNSYAARTRFTYDQRMTIKPPANIVIPTGLGLQGRPGDLLLGARLPGRKQPFACFAGTQVEEIELTFAEGLTLPQKTDNRRIETKSFVYIADYQLEDRTLKIRREFVSRVPGQVCAPEIEAEIAQPMRDVVASNATRMAFPAPPQGPATPVASDPIEIKRTAVVDQPLKADFLYSLNPDCSSIGIAGVRVIEAPKHGKLAIDKGAGFSNYPQDDLRQACNRRRSEGMLVNYQPEAGYLGPDSVTVDIVYGNGTSRKRHYNIAVDPKPAPFEMARAALAGQEVRIGFHVNIDPDCTSNQFASVRIVEAPQRGEATLKGDTGFANFAKDNPRFECNKQRIDGTAVLYRGAEGYTGKDSLTVRIVYADGRETDARYAIEVK